jgi:hypothetical protein
MAATSRTFACMLLIGLIATAISCEAANAGTVTVFALS